MPEAALKFLNLTYTDKDIVNLLIYGIEGRDYIMNDDGTVSYPEGEDSTTVPYTAQLSCGTLGNFFIMYPTAGTDPASLEWEQKQNEEAKTSPAMGFTFDSSKLNTQYTAVKMQSVSICLVCCAVALTPIPNWQSLIKLCRMQVIRIF